MSPQIRGSCASSRPQTSPSCLTRMKLHPPYNSANLHYWLFGQAHDVRFMSGIPMHEGLRLLQEPGPAMSSRNPASVRTLPVGRRPWPPVRRVATSYDPAPCCRRSATTTHRYGRSLTAWCVAPGCLRSRSFTTRTPLGLPLPGIYCLTAWAPGVSNVRTPLFPEGS